MKKTKFLNKNYENELITKSVKLLKTDSEPHKSSKEYKELLDGFKSYIEYVESIDNYQKSRDMNRLLFKLKYY